MGILRKFSQYSLLDSTIFDFHGLSDTGYVYYPKVCADGTTRCKVHIFLHGCTETVLNTIDRLDNIKEKGFI